MSYFDDFTDTFADIIEGELTDTLSQELSFDFARRAAKEIVDAIDREHEERFMLIDRETGELETRRVYKTFAEAEQATKEELYKHCLISVLLVNP